MTVQAVELLFTCQATACHKMQDHVGAMLSLHHLAHNSVPKVSNLATVDQPCGVIEHQREPADQARSPQAGLAPAPIAFYAHREAAQVGGVVRVAGRAHAADAGGRRVAGAVAVLVSRQLRRRARHRRRAARGAGASTRFRRCTLGSSSVLCRQHAGQHCAFIAQAGCQSC